MVTEGVLNWLAGLLLSLIGRPSTDYSPGLDESIEAAYGELAALNFFLPITELMSLVAIMIALAPPMLATTIALWVGVGVIRGGQSRI